MKISSYMDSNAKMMLGLALSPGPLTQWKAYTHALGSVVKGLRIDVRMKLWQGKEIMDREYKEEGFEEELEKKMKEVGEKPYFLQFDIEGHGGGDVLRKVSEVHKQVVKDRNYVIDRNQRGRTRKHILRMMMFPKAHHEILQREISIKAKRRQLLRSYGCEGYVDYIIKKTHREVRRLEYAADQLY